jgi:hypothetical protein
VAYIHTHMTMVHAISAKIGSNIVGPPQSIIVCAPV